MARPVGGVDGLHQEVVGVGLAFDGLGCTFEKHSYLCTTDLAKCQAILSPSIRDYNGVLAKRLLKTKAVISDFDAEKPVFACFIQKFVEVGLALN